MQLLVAGLITVWHRWGCERFLDAMHIPLKNRAGRGYFPGYDFQFFACSAPFFMSSHGISFDGVRHRDPCFSATTGSHRKGFNLLKRGKVSHGKTRRDIVWMRLAPQDSISGFKVSLQQAVQFFGNSRQQSADFLSLSQAHSARFLLKAQALFCSHLKRGFPVHLHGLAQLSFQESVIS